MKKCFAYVVMLLAVACSLMSCDDDNKVDWAKRSMFEVGQNYVTMPLTGGTGFVMKNELLASLRLTCITPQDIFTPSLEVHNGVTFATCNYSGMSIYDDECLPGDVFVVYSEGVEGYVKRYQGIIDHGGTFVKLYQSPEDLNFEYEYGGWLNIKYDDDQGSLKLMAAPNDTGKDRYVTLEFMLSDHSRNNLVLVFQTGG